MNLKNGESNIISEIKIKLIPGSSKNQITGKENDIYKIKVTSPPIEGRANKSLIQLLAKKLNSSKTSIEIVSGEHSRLKYLRITGKSCEDIDSLLLDKKD